MSKRHSLLVVDDEPGVVDSIYDLFRYEYSVHKAGSADEALGILCDQEVHIVMTDQRMPFMSGVELLAKIKTRYPDAIRILFTGYADIEAVIEAINQGNVYRYVVKPWNTQELITIVRQAADQYDLIVERKELLERLRVANDLKRNFIAIASHELNTPTFIIAGMAKLASQLAEEKPGKAIACLESIRSASARLEQIIANMLRLVSADRFSVAMCFDEIKVGHLIDSSVDEMLPFLEARNIRIEVHADLDATFIGCEHLVEDILENLISNAVRFSRDGSVVHLYSKLEDEMIKFIVADQGIGIKKEDLPNVFEPFFTSKDVLHHFSGTYEFGSRGIGLGLTVARKFTELHNGSIDIESEEGKGTTVTVKLPVKQLQPEEEEAAEPTLSTLKDI